MLRKEAGLSQKELAARLGVQPSVVSKYENGGIQLQEDTLRQLVIIFDGVSADFILGLSDDRKHGYNFNSVKANEVYEKARDQIAMLPKDGMTKLLVKQAIESLNAVSATLERLKGEMLKLASQLPEFTVVMDMRGVGDSLGPQLMAEIGDVSRFAHRSAITSFAGVDPGTDQSGDHEAKSVRTTKSGSPELRRALFLVMDCLLKTMPQDEPVYRFMDKKRAEGKPYLVYMTAGANKFLRIYYGRVKEYLAKLEELSAPDPSPHI